MANKQCMIQVSGTTYRIQAVDQRHRVFRVSDDRSIGAFQHRPALHILESEVAPEELLEVAKAALRRGLLPWAHADLSRPDSAQRHAPPQPTRRGSAAQNLTSLLSVLWPSA